MPARDCFWERTSRSHSSSPAPACSRKWPCLSEAGISIEQVWKLATRDAGDRLGIEGLGRIEAGAPADILLFRRDPTQSLDNLASLEGVIAAGRLYRSADLAQALHASTAYFNSPLIKPLARRGAEQALARALGAART